MFGSPRFQFIRKWLRSSFLSRAKPLKATKFVELLEKLDVDCQENSVPGLLALLLRSEGEVAARAAATLEQMAKTSNSLEIARIDASVRQMSEYTLGEIEIRDVDFLSHGLPGALGFLSCHPSGFIRESAVRSLSKLSSGRELPFLMIRVNDWVSQVREVAKCAVLDRIRPEYAPYFIKYLRLVFRLEGQSRQDHREVTEPVFRLLRAPECRQALLNGISDPDRHNRRAVYRMILSTSGIPSDAIDPGLRSDDTVIRLIAAREARVRLEGQALDDMLLVMRSDRFMPVRREALYGYVERRSHLVSTEFQASLFDPHPSIRETARFYLQKLGMFDFAKMYRERLDSTDADTMAISIAGLGETGGVEDALRLDRFLGHPSARVRKAAIRSLGHIDPERHFDQFLTALTDNAAGVARAARDILRQHLYYILRPKPLWKLIESANETHSRRMILTLINRLAWWDSAPMLVAAADTEDEEITQCALGHLKKWRSNLHRLSVRPSHEQITLLEDACRRHGSKLDEATLKDLEAHISYAKRESRGCDV